MSALVVIVRMSFAFPRENSTQPAYALRQIPEGNEFRSLSGLAYHRPLSERWFFLWEFDALATSPPRSGSCPATLGLAAAGGSELGSRQHGDRPVLSRGGGARPRSRAQAGHDARPRARQRHRHSRSERRAPPRADRLQRARFQLEEADREGEILINGKKKRRAPSRARRSHHARARSARLQHVHRVRGGARPRAKPATPTATSRACVVCTRSASGS